MGAGLARYLSHAADLQLPILASHADLRHTGPNTRHSAAGVSSISVQAEHHPLPFSQVKSLTAYNAG